MNNPNDLSFLFLAATSFNLEAYIKLLDLGIDSSILQGTRRSIDLLFSASLILEEFGENHFPGADVRLFVSTAAVVFMKYRNLNSDERLEREREIIADLIAHVVLPAPARL